MNLEPIRALIKLAGDLENQLYEGDGAYPEDYHDVHTSAVVALPALSQLLEAVTNLEKLIAKLEADDAESARQYWANKERMQRGETIIMNVIVGTEGYFHNPVIDDLKRLLHPEDTK